MRPHLLLLPLFILMTTSCAEYKRRAVPPELGKEAEVVGMPGIRSFGSEINAELMTSLMDSFFDEHVTDFQTDEAGVTTYPVLSLSGGGHHGAYGAGLLAGWAEEGSRPVFKVITGVSTGALMAPYVFIGPQMDDRIKKIYTTSSTKDIIREKGFLSILTGNSMASSEPMRKNLEKQFGMRELNLVAERYEQGRRLYIATVNLDFQRLVAWDMGKIAVQRNEQALALFRKIMLASASIPVALPPVYFDVEANGEEYNEMHVDGGTVTQVFSLLPATRDFNAIARSRGLDPARMRLKLYVIRNAIVSSTWTEVKDDTLAIADQAILTVTRAQALGDFYRMFAFSRKHQADFNLAFIPSSFKPNPKELFDPDEMKILYELGYQEALAGYPWRKVPPGWESAWE